MKTLLFVVLFTLFYTKNYHFTRFKAQPTVAAVAAAAVVQLLMRRLLLLLMLLSSTAKTCESSLNRVSQKHAFDFQTLSLAV